MKTNCLLKLLFTCVTGLLVSGCGTNHIKLAYTAQPGTKGPLSTIKPISLALQVNDGRDLAERDRQADLKNGYGMTIGSAVSEKDITQVLFDALKSEFENNGHKIVSTGETKVD